MTDEKSDFIVPDDAVFERAPVTPHDKRVKPTARDSLHLEGDSSRGEVVEYLHFDDDKFHHELKQDIEPTLNWVKEQHLHQGSQVGKSKSGEWYHAARVDRVVILAWLHKRNLTWNDFKGKVIDAFLDDSDNQAFRLWQGRMG